jgi:hypothetical protein
MSWDHVENPAAYEAAIHRRIQANANTTRRRKLDAAIATDSPEFRAWLLGQITPELEALRLASQDEFDQSFQSTGPAAKAYHAAWDAFRKRTGPVPEFLRDSLDNWGGLTEKQLAFARKIFAERIAKSETRDAAEAERRANATPWAAGRQEVTGVVQSARWESFSVNRWASTTSLKALLLLADGRKLWTTIPARLHPADGSEEGAKALKGTTVSIKVTVELSKDDPTMGFGKRPN